jgi:hypothetical protein
MKIIISCNKTVKEGNEKKTLCERASKLEKIKRHSIEALPKIKELQNFNWKR